MDHYNYYSSNSLGLTTKHVERPRPQPRSVHSSLHSVRKPPTKPMKKTAAPYIPPPRVYRVDPANFRQVVQKLTAAPQFQYQRLQSLAPPPLDLVTQLLPPPSLPLSDNDISEHLHLFGSPERVTQPSVDIGGDFLSEASSGTKPGQFYDNSSMPAMSFGICLSPLHTWCSFPLLSPGTLSSLEQGTVL